jgi:hypothetical protein
LRTAPAILAIVQSLVCVCRTGLETNTPGPDSDACMSDVVIDKEDEESFACFISTCAFMIVPAPVSRVKGTYLVST